MTVRVIDNEWIPLADGTRLAARIWLPENADELPVPAILEYLPYRKDDGTARQDATRHPYFASRGYAAVRVDIRGTGDSDGILCDEYLRQEQDDALEVLAWIAARPWCSGRIGMIGYSWGGFNGLQIAARRPPELGAIVTAYSTDDRYADDCHYMGGCVLGSDMLKWASSMRIYNALPPDPRHRDDWREVWCERLEHTPPFVESWLSHQTYDAFWKQGSVAEDYAAIRAATLVVGGWADAYTNAVPRLLSGLTCERRGIIGPWAHVLPYGGVPGPAIAFRKECLRWFDRWLKDVDTGVEHDSMVRVWMQESVPPQTFYAERAGRWVGLDRWPAEDERVLEWRFGEGGVLAPPGPQSLHAAAAVTIHSPAYTGATAGVWCANGMADEMPGDQRADDALSACFDSAPLESALEVLGFPRVLLRVAADSGRALVAVRLCEVAPDGSSTLVSWGLLNLTHRNGHERSEPLVPGDFYDVVVQLNVIGHRFAPGSVLRVALSQAYWPHAWPSPQPTTLTIDVGRCSLRMPPLPADATDLGAPFEPPDHEANRAPLRTGERRRLVSTDESGRVHTICDTQHSVVELETGTRYEITSEDRWDISDDDPLSARTTAVREESLVRDGWSVRSVVRATLHATPTEFVVHDELAAFDEEKLVYSSRRHIDIPRDGV